MLVCNGLSQDLVLKNAATVAGSEGIGDFRALSYLAES